MKGFTLVSTLVTIAIIAILAVVVVNGSLGDRESTRKDGKGKTVLGASMMTARDEVCRSNISQVRQSLQISNSTGEEGFPASLNDLKLGKDFQSCPVGHEPYQYNSQTGEVKCVHPGHEKY